LLPSGNDAAVALAIEFGKVLLECDKCKNAKIPFYNNNNKNKTIEIPEQCDEDIEDGENELY